MTEAPVSSKDQSRHDPWAKDCPSTHCNRRDECCSPNECCSPTRPKGEAKAALLARLREPDVREAVVAALQQTSFSFTGAHGVDMHREQAAAALAVITEKLTP